MKHKPFSFVVTICIIITTNSIAREISKNLQPDNFSQEQYIVLKQSFGKNKTIPAVYEKQILIALSYFPELKNTHIEFLIKHAYTPLSTRPFWLSFADAEKSRTYIITISDCTIPKLSPILFN